MESLVLHLRKPRPRLELGHLITKAIELAKGRAEMGTHRNPPFTWLPPAIQPAPRHSSLTGAITRLSTGTVRMKKNQKSESKAQDAALGQLSFIVQTLDLNFRSHWGSPGLRAGSDCERP